jgi:hypothetical protein
MKIFRNYLLRSTRRGFAEKTIQIGKDYKNDE